MHTDVTAMATDSAVPLLWDSSCAVLLIILSSSLLVFEAYALKRSQLFEFAN